MSPGKKLMIAKFLITGYWLLIVAAFIVLVAFIFGCASTTYSTVLPDGTKVWISQTVFCMSSENKSVSGTLPDKGILMIGQSKKVPDPNTTSAVSKGVVQGIGTVVAGGI